MYIFSNDLAYAKRVQEIRCLCNGKLYILFIIVLGKLPYVKVVDNFDAEYEVMS